VPDQFTDEQLDWTARFTGKDPRPAAVTPPKTMDAAADEGIEYPGAVAAKAIQPDATHAAPAAGGTGPPPAAAKPLPAGVPGVAETFEIQFEPPTDSTACGGDVKFKWKVVLQVTATFFPKQDTQITLGYNTKEQMIGKVARKWALGDLMKALGAPDVLQLSKFGVEGKMTDTKGLSVKATFSVPFKYGTVEVAGYLVKWEPNKAPVYGTLELSFTTASIPIPDYQEDGVDVLSITVTVKGSASIEPQYVKIIAEKVIDASKAAVEDAGGGALGVADVALDALIPAALAAVAIGTVAGVIDVFVQQVNLDNLKAGLATAIISLRTGIYDGLSGGAAAGSDALYQQGWNLGHQAYQQAIDKIAQRADLPPPDEIKAEAQDAAKKAMRSWPAWAQIEDHLRWAFFKKWVDENHGLGTFEGDARLAVQWCFGVVNEDANGPHMKYWADKSSLPQFMKT
jgi:hypothetical protein